ncbi:MAG: IS256 family transposase [Anaerolineae bacterium]
MALPAKDTQSAEFRQTDFQAWVRDTMREFVRIALTAILEEEVTALIGAAPYEHSATRRDRRNGTYTRNLDTSVGRIHALPVPRTRRGFKTQLFERYQRRQPAVDQSLGAMFIRGLSPQAVGGVLHDLTGVQPSASSVSRVFHKLEDEYQAWKERRLASHYVYCFADGTYFSVIYQDEGCKMPILAVIGIRPDGTREVLGFSVGDRENQAAWEQLLDDLKVRGTEQVDLWITDGNRAMLNAVEAKFPAAKRQRCIKHKMENVLAYVPQKQRDAVEPELRAIFYQDTRTEAEQQFAAFCAKYEKTYPSAVECLQKDQATVLTFYDFPREHWKTIRTTNVIERLFLEVKKRTHKMNAAFRNENSCLLMFYAVIRGVQFKKVKMAN